MDFSHSLIGSTQILSFLKIRKFNTLTLQVPTPQNGQTHTNNSSAFCRQIVWVCLAIFWGWCLKGQGSRNPFHATGLFLYSLKTSERQVFSCFQGEEKKTSGIKCLKKPSWHFCSIVKCGEKNRIQFSLNIYNSWELGNEWASKDFYCL